MKFGVCRLEGIEEIVGREVVSYASFDKAFSEFGNER